MNTNELVQISVDKLLEIAGRNSVGIFDIISLITTVTLGILALVLAYFIYRLSDRFETQSTLALESIQTLATEIRQMVKFGVLDQKEMSNKMLDHLLLGSYGTPTKDDQDKLDGDAQFIGKVSALIDEKLSDTSTPKKEKAELKREIQKLSVTKASKDKHIISDTLFRKISIFTPYPAFTVLLDSILKHSITNTENIEARRQEDSIPGNYQNGIEQLLEKEVLVGNGKNFKPNPKFAKELQAFMDANSEVIEILRAFYETIGDSSTEAVRKQERIFSESLIF